MIRAAFYVELLLHTAALVVEPGPTTASTAFVRPTHRQISFMLVKFGKLVLVHGFPLVEGAGFLHQLLVEGAGFLHQLLVEGAGFPTPAILVEGAGFLHQLYTSGGCWVSYTSY